VLNQGAHQGLAALTGARFSLSRIESGARRWDGVEFVAVAKALKVDPQVRDRPGVHVVGEISLNARARENAPQYAESARSEMIVRDLVVLVSVWLGSAEARRMSKSSRRPTQAFWNAGCSGVKRPLTSNIRCDQVFEVQTYACASNMKWATGIGLCLMSHISF